MTSTSMSIQTKEKTTPTQTQSFTSARTNLLQRKCACGGTPGLDGECAECRRKRLALQGRSTQQTGPSSVPPIVHEVLHSPGKPLDQATRILMEPRFGHDFSRVRVHTDAQAMESARVVNALAYTVGKDMVFGANQYQPQAIEGRRLLAHELTHTIQQSADRQGAQGKLQTTAPGDAAEQEAEMASHAIAQGHSFAMTAGKPVQIARQAPPVVSGLGAGSISAKVTGLTIEAKGTFSPCTDCKDGLETIQVVWATGGPRVGKYQTGFPPLAATYDSFVDGGKNSPGGAVYSGNHPYYIGRSDLPASYGYNPAQASAGSVLGCTANHKDTPLAALPYSEAFFETAFVCLNYQGKGKDKILNSFKWGFANKGTIFKPSPYSFGFAVEQSSSPSAKFTETLKADYSGYSYV